MVELTFGAVLGAPDPEQERILQGLGMPLQHIDTSGLFNTPEYGGIQTAGAVALSDIDATPQFLPAAAGAVTFPQGVTQDFANDGIILLDSGVWSVSFAASLSFVGDNSPRDLVLQLYNVTDDSVFITSPVAVGRNQEGANPSVVFMFELAEIFVGDLFSMRLLSTADTFTTAILNSYTFNWIHVDQLRTS